MPATPPKTPKISSVKAAPTPVIQKGAPVLRQIAKSVPAKAIRSAKLKRIIERMQRVIAEQDDAVAVAAPQIGEPWRIFVVAGKVFLPDYAELDADQLRERQTAGLIPPDAVYINPEIVKLSRQKQTLLEGCLSVRWLYGNVERAQKATVKALDEHGKPFTRGASGLLAQIFQHETDHLNGILFIDLASDLREEPPQDDSTT